jgi:putative sigma-54 modulation protein
MPDKIFNDEALMVHIFGKSVQVTEPMKNYAIEKISKVAKITHQNIHVHCTLDIQKLECHVSLLMTFSHFKVKVEAVTAEMYSAIDKATDKLSHALKKWKGKLLHHHHRPLVIEEADVQVMEPYLEEELDVYNQEIASLQKREYVMPKIVATKQHPIKTLTPSEAMMKLELSCDPFLIFRSQEDLRIKILHRLEDGNYGLINPQT